MHYEIVEGDLLDQPVEAIVNPWNRNTIPWWLLLPQGVSGAIKRRAGTQPFKEVAKSGRLQIGQAVSTSAGNLPYLRIIHVAGINDLWRASEQSIRESVKNAIAVASAEGLASLAIPLIGAGSGSFSCHRSSSIIEDELKKLTSDLSVRIVVFAKGNSNHG